MRLYDVLEEAVACTWLGGGCRLCDEFIIFFFKVLINSIYERAKAMPFCCRQCVFLFFCPCAVDNGTVPSPTHDCLVVVVVAVNGINASVSSLVTCLRLAYHLVNFSAIP
jgi:hypothetical protein